MAKISPTHAKEVAFYFFDKTETRATKAIIARTIKQVKDIMGDGYTKDEMIKCIDYIVDVKKVDMYSIGYLASGINNTLRYVKDMEKRELIESQREEIDKVKQGEVDTEVSYDAESTERNKAKLQRRSGKSKFRKSFDFDLFTKS